MKSVLLEPSSLLIEHQRYGSSHDGPSHDANGHGADGMRGSFQEQTWPIEDVEVILTQFRPALHDFPLVSEKHVPRTGEGNHPGES